MSLKVEVLPGHVVDRGTNKIYHPGEKFTCRDEKEYERLVMGGVAGPCEGETGLADEKARIEALVAAIGKLDGSDESVWTISGRPQTEALEKVAGRKVTARERDEAWILFKKGAEEDSQ